MSKPCSSFVLAALVGLGACATPPMGPTIAVVPAPSKPPELFEEDNAVCKRFASEQVAGGAEAANEQQAGTAALGTALGAGLGAAVGGGRGAAVGAATGAVVGTTAGAANAQAAQYSLQQRYDIAYSQCMYSHGNQIPGYPPPTAPPPPAR